MSKKLVRQKKMPKHSNMSHKFTKISLGLFCVNHLQLDIRLILKCYLYILWDSIGKKKQFSFQQLLMVNRFLFRHESLRPPLILWPHQLEHVQFLYMLHQSLWIDICVAPVVSWRNCLLNVIYLSSLLQSSASSSNTFPESWG